MERQLVSRNNGHGVARNSLESQRNAGAEDHRLLPFSPNMLAGHGRCNPSAGEAEAVCLVRPQEEEYASHIYYQGGPTTSILNCEAP